MELDGIFDQCLGQTNLLIKRVPIITLFNYSAFAHSDTFSSILSALIKNLVRRKKTGWN